MEKLVIIYIIIWIIGIISAYPRHKKWCIKENNNLKNWSNGDVLTAIFVCFLFWYFIWFWFIVSHIEEFTITNKWWNKNSK